MTKPKKKYKKRKLKKTFEDIDVVAKLPKQNAYMVERVRNKKLGESLINKGKEPPKSILINEIIDDLELKGYRRVTSSQVKQIVEILIGLSDEELKVIKRSNQVPRILKTVAKGLLDKNKDFEILSSLLDRAHGKATQAIDIDVGAKPIPILGGASVGQLEQIEAKEDIDGRFKIGEDVLAEINLGEALIQAKEVLADESDLA